MPTLSLQPEDLAFLKSLPGFRVDERWLGDAFELALATYTGQGARESVMDRLTGRRPEDPHYDFTAGRRQQKVDAKGSFRWTDVSGLMLSFSPRADVAYVQGQLVHSLDDVKAGKRASFRLWGWRTGATSQLFRPHPQTNKPWCPTEDLLSMEEYLAWLS